MPKKHEMYEQDDQILPMVWNLPTPLNIRIEITTKEVTLQVGPRDWTWSRKTGQLLNAGTVLHFHPGTEVIQ